MNGYMYTGGVATIYAKGIRKNAFAYTCYDIYTPIPKTWDGYFSLLMVSW